MGISLLLALFIGVIAGLRTFTAPALVSWIAYLRWIDLSDSWLAFMGYAWTPWIFTVLGVGELITDQLPSTPSRTVPPQFGARIVSGALCGAAIGANQGAQGAMLSGLLAGSLGAVIGTLGGRRLRARLAATFGNDHPAALIEDGIAVGGAFLLGFAIT